MNSEILVSYKDGIAYSNFDVKCIEQLSTTHCAYIQPCFALMKDVSSNISSIIDSETWQETQQWEAYYANVEVQYVCAKNAQSYMSCERQWKEDAMYAAFETGDMEIIEHALQDYEHAIALEECADAYVDYYELWMTNIEDEILMRRYALYVDHGMNTLTKTCTSIEQIMNSLTGLQQAAYLTQKIRYQNCKKLRKTTNKDTQYIAEFKQLNAQANAVLEVYYAIWLIVSCLLYCGCASEEEYECIIGKFAEKRIAL